MQSLVLLGFSSFLIYSHAQAQVPILCTKIYSSNVAPMRPPGDPMRETWNLFQEFSDQPVFGGTKRARRKEREHMEKDLKAVESEMLRFLQKNPHLRETLELWKDFNHYWTQKLIEFKNLPLEKQKQLKSSLEIPLSIGTKHLVSFLEASNHKRWKLGRLHNLLTVHTKHPNVDVETALFLIHRETSKYFSRWDFVRCRY